MIGLPTAERQKPQPATPISNAFLRTAVRHLLPRLLRAVFAGDRGFGEKMHAAAGKRAVLCLGRAGVRAGAAGLDRDRLCIVVSPQQADAGSDAAAGAGG